MPVPHFPLLRSLGGGYVSRYIEKVKELGLVEIRVDEEKYSARNLLGITE